MKLQFVFSVHSLKAVKCQTLLSILWENKINQIQTLLPSKPWYDRKIKQQYTRKAMGVLNGYIPASES